MIFSLLLLYKKRKERHLYVLEPDSCSILMNSKMIKTKGSCSWSQNYKLDDRMYVDVDRRCIAGFYIYNAFQNAIIPHTKSGPILFSTEQLWSHPLMTAWSLCWVVFVALSNVLSCSFSEITGGNQAPHMLLYCCCRSANMSWFFIFAMCLISFMLLCSAFLNNNNTQSCICHLVSGL